MEVPADNELHRQLEQAQRQLARLRRRADRGEAALEAARLRLRERRQDLARMRAALVQSKDDFRELAHFSLDIFPGLTMPDSVRQVVEAVRAERLTYLTRLQLESLVLCVVETEVSGREGIVVEAGTALGGSAIAMAAAKSPDRPMRVYDVFGLIPPPSDADGEDVIRRYDHIAAGRSKGLGDDIYYGYRQDLLGEVTASFARHDLPVDEHHVELIEGLFQDTLEIDGPVALAHVDADWYDSTMTCLSRIAPRLTAGGRIVIDDYYSWSGCRRAVDEYFADRRGFQVEKRAKVHIVRK